MHKASPRERNGPTTSHHTHRTQSDGCGSQPNQAAIARVQLMRGISIIITELIDDLGDSIVVAFSKSGSDEIFHSVRFQSQFQSVERDWRVEIKPPSSRRMSSSGEAHEKVTDKRIEKGDSLQGTHFSFLVDLITQQAMKVAVHTDATAGSTASDLIGAYASASTVAEVSLASASLQLMGSSWSGQLGWRLTGQFLRLKIFAIPLNPPVQ